MALSNDALEEFGNEYGEDEDLEDWELIDDGASWFFLTGVISPDEYTPSTDKAQAMELLIEYGMAVNKSRFGKSWVARIPQEIHIHNPLTYSGDTPMIAICRAVVASKFGEEVDG